MHFKAILPVLATTASTSFANLSIIYNQCDFDVFVTSVGQSAGETLQVASGNYWAEEQYFDGTGTAIKITLTKEELSQDGPVLTFAYSYHPGQNIYYGLSTVGGFDFYDETLRLHGPDGSKVEQIVWNGVPGPDHTAAYAGSTDLTLELCE